MKNSSIEIKSYSVNEILSKPPSWTVRWGITAIFSVLIILLIGSMFFSYPDIISAPIVITSSNMPVQMISRASGRIRLFVKESDTVHKGKIVAYLENSTNYEDYLKLRKLLTSKEITSTDFPENNMKLGALQNYYQNLISIISEEKEFTKANYHNKKLILLAKQLKSQKKSYTSLLKQISNSELQLRIARTMLERDSLLLIQKAISTLDYEKSTSAYLSIYLQHESFIFSINNLQGSILQTEQTVFEIEQEKINQVKEFVRSMRTSVELLKSKVIEWEQTFILVSPIKGISSLTKYWQNNQNISTGDVLMTIIPIETSFVIGKISLPFAGSGEVQKGQKVNIKLDNYPYLEYGYLKTSVSNISSSSITSNNQKQLVISVVFNDRLITNYNKTIPVNEEMTGVAEIITKDLSAFERIILPMKNLLNKINK